MSKSRVTERSAYALQAAMEPTFGASFDLLATASQGVAKLRELILSLAVRGKLVPQDPADESAAVLLDRIRADKERLVVAGKITRGKPLSVVSDDEKMFEAPDSWVWARFDAVINDSEAGWSPSCEGSPRRGDTWGVLKVSAVSWNEFRSCENKKLPVSLTPRPEYEVHAGDFLISRANTADLVARSVVAKNPEPKLMLSDKIIRLDISALANRAYFNIVNNARSSRAYYTANASGTSSSMKNVGRQVILGLPVPIPPLAEQARIVARVEELMQLCDALEAHGRLQDEQHARLVATLFEALAASGSAEELAENWQRIATHFDLLLDRPEAVDALEQTLLQLAIRGLLVPQDPADEPASGLLDRIRAEKNRFVASGKIKRDRPLLPVADHEKPFEVHSSWEWLRVGDICSVVTDGEHLTPQRVDDSSAVPLVTAKNVRNEHMDYTVTDFVPVEVAEKCWARCKPEALDILMVSVGATLGRLSILRDAVDMVLVRSVTVLRPIQAVVSSDYLAWHLRAPESQREIWRSVRQSAQPCLYLAKSSALLVALPPLAEQHRIVARVEQLRRLCADLRKRLQQAHATQSRFADALVSAAAQSPSC